MAIAKKTSHRDAGEGEEPLLAAAGNVSCHYGNQIPQKTQNTAIICSNLGHVPKGL